MGTTEQGVKQAVENCLRVKAGERVIIITDKETIEIGSTLKNTIEKITGKIQFFVMEDFGDQIRVMDKDLPISDIETMRQIFSDSISQPRFQTLVLGSCRFTGATNFCNSLRI